MLVRAWLPLAILLTAAVPSVGADITNGNVVPFGVDSPGAPQAYCTIVQTAPASVGNPAHCEVFNGFLKSVGVLRLRIVGEAHARTYVDLVNGNSHTQLADLQCEAKPEVTPFDKLQRGDIAVGFEYALCSKLFSTFGQSGTFELRLLIDGPGRASATAWLERPPTVSLP